MKRNKNPEKLVMKRLTLKSSLKSTSKQDGRGMCPTGSETTR